MKPITHRRTPLLVTFAIYLICGIVTLAVGGQDETAIAESQQVEEIPVIIPVETETQYSATIKTPVTAAPMVETTVEELVEDEVPVEYTHTYYDIPLRYGLQDCVVYYLDYMDVDLDATYIYALIYHESRFDPTATGSSGDSGYVQILQKYFDEIYADMVEDYPQLAESEGWICDPYDEKTNLACGIYYLNQAAMEVTGKGVTVNNLSAALTGYNRGPSGAKEWYRSNGSYVTPYSKAVIEIAHIIQENNGLSEELKNN